MFHVRQEVRVSSGLVAQAVVVAGVGGQRAKQHLERCAGGKVGGRRLAGIRAGRRAVFQVKLHSVTGEHIGGDGMVGRAARTTEPAKGVTGMEDVAALKV